MICEANEPCPLPLNRAVGRYQKRTVLLLYSLFFSFFKEHREGISPGPDKVSRNPTAECILRSNSRIQVQGACLHSHKVARGDSCSLVRDERGDWGSGDCPAPFPLKYVCAPMCHLKGDARDI